MGSYTQSAADQRAVLRLGICVGKQNHLTMHIEPLGSGRYVAKERRAGYRACLKEMGPGVQKTASLRQELPQGCLSPLPSA